MSLFIDVTELVGWQGKPTGVPRVMDEVAKRFSKNQEVTFVTWQHGDYKRMDYPIVKPPEIKSKPDAVHVRVAKKVHSKSKIVRKLVSVSRAKINKQPAPSSEEKYTPERGDILIVLADWHGSDPTFIEYLLTAKERGVNLVQFVYDLLPIVTPQYSGHSTGMLKFYSTRIYPLCSLMFSISEYTKKDTIDWLKKNNLRTPKIEVIRLGDDFTRVVPRKPTEISLYEEYLLCVGTIEARKNHTLLYKTYKLANSRGIELPKIMIVGRLGWLSEDLYKTITTDPETKDKFVFLHHVSDNELSWLYENSLFTVYPSFYEGWGLPIAESIAHGKAVIASNTSSMPEIAGDLIDYFDPTSPDECLQRIVYMLKIENRKRAETKLLAYEPHTWDETYKVIDKALKGLM